MAIHNNFPTISWIKLDGITVAKEDKVYTVSDFKTNLKYVYWNEDNPYQLTSSNVMQDRTSTKFLIVVNNKGDCVLVPNEGLTVNFDGNSVGAINEHIWGLYEKDKEFGEKFVSVEQDIDGIRTMVGETQEDLGKVSEHISKVEQKADSIDLSVKKLDKEYQEDKEIQALREEINKSIIDANSALGLFKAKITETFKDNEISENEKNEIQAQIDVLKDRKEKVIIQVDKVIDLVKNSENPSDTNKLESQKQVFINAIDNVISLVNTAISDKVIVPSEITTITTAFGKANVETNTLKNILDDTILLGAGGTISEELARIGIKSDEIVLSVNKVEDKTDGVDKKYSEILLSPNGIVSRVESVETGVDENGNRIDKAESSITQLAGEISSKVSAGEVSSIIKQSPDEIAFGFNKISNQVVINSNGLTVKKGHIACDSIKSSSSNPIITLFDGNGLNCALDATASMNQGTGNSIRLKRDDKNYIMVSAEGLGIFTGGYQEFSFYSTSTANNMKTSQGELSCTSSGLKYRGSYLAYENHKHNVSEITSAVSDGFKVGNVKTGTDSNGSYMGGYISTTGNVRAKGGFQEGLFATTKDYKGEIEVKTTTTLIPNLEYIGEGKVINGECIVELPSVLVGASIKYIVQITPIGDNPNIYISKKESESFTVKGDDCTFDYIIKGVLPKKPKRLKNSK